MNATQEQTAQAPEIECHARATTFYYLEPGQVILIIKPGHSEPESIQQVYPATSAHFNARAAGDGKVWGIEFARVVNDPTTISSVTRNADRTEYYLCSTTTVGVQRLDAALQIQDPSELCYLCGHAERTGTLKEDGLWHISSGHGGIECDDSEVLRLVDEDQTPLIVTPVRALAF